MSYLILLSGPMCDIIVFDESLPSFSFKSDACTRKNDVETFLKERGKHVAIVMKKLLNPKEKGITLIVTND